MCPGFPYAVHPQVSNKKGPAHILVAGDGDFSAHLMRPNANGTFDRQLIKKIGGTVGSITYGDIDGDGWLEFFVPNYDNGYIEVYKFFDSEAKFLTE